MKRWEQRRCHSQDRTAHRGPCSRSGTSVIVHVPWSPGGPLNFMGVDRDMIIMKMCVLETTGLESRSFGEEIKSSL